jgi:hypothetical protein
MKVETQFSVFLANKPGVLSQVCNQLAAAKVNILALSMMDSSEHGVMRFIADDAARTRRALIRLNLPTTETDVISMELPNRPGALADVCDRLSNHHVNVNYAYCTGGSGAGRNGKTSVVLKVADTKKAQKVLEQPRARRRDGATAIRRPTVRGR